MNEPANDIVTYFPMAWLPGLLVPLAYYLHFMSLRQVLLKNKGINGIIKNWGKKGAKLIISPQAGSGNSIVIFFYLHLA